MKLRNNLLHLSCS